HREIGYVLEYGAYVAMSILGEQRNILLSISGGLGVAWLMLVLVPRVIHRESATVVRAARLAIGILNLHVGFFEAIFLATVAIAASGTALWLRLPLVTGVVLFGTCLLELRWPWRPSLVETKEWEWKIQWGAIAPVVSLLLLLWLVHITPGQPGA